MFRASSEEQEYLKKVIHLIEKKQSEISNKISKYGMEIETDKRTLWENIYELDPEEIAGARQMIESQIDAGEKVQKEFMKLSKMRQNPYFARVDFVEEEDGEKEKIYIGVGTLLAEEGMLEMMVYDWRAPISGIFYEFELGNAYYEAPMGLVHGTLMLKRQFKLEDDKIVYYADSGTSIHDEVLIECLAKSSDQKMHNIVATIQKEQNAVIRNAEAENLIIQGVAGSGKTSIALHRAAYLLYKYKGKLTSKEILIVSPNKVFTEYIASVLPELDEENILECEVNQIAKNELPDNYIFEEAWQQSEKMIEGKDKDYIARVQFKASAEFCQSLKEYVDLAIDAMFVPQEFRVGPKVYTKEILMNQYRRYHNLAPADRIEKIYDGVLEAAQDDGLKVAKRKLRDLLNKMLQFHGELDFYKDFLKSMGREKMLYCRKNHFEYADMFPLAYIKVRIKGASEILPIKHVIIDEMQDYSPICFAVINEIYPCQKTVLGDVAQSVSGIATSLEKIAASFPNCVVIELNKSYRSSFEIMEFSKKITQKGKEIIPLERHGDEVKITSYTDKRKTISKLLQKAKKQGIRNIGLICKTNEQAQNLYETLQDLPDVSLITSEIPSSVRVSSVQMAKGLEFDYVIVVDCDEKNYSSESDRDLLYVACTRAMHQLELIYSESVTSFVK